MSNSPLISYTKISPNRTSPRNHVIDTVSIHCVVGQCSIETLGNIFSPSSYQASSNYGIGPDGRIGMYVEEKDRSWCTSDSDNDNRAITIEVASDTTHPYAVTDAAYKSLINLLVDICKRNNIKELKWKADPSLIGKPDKQNMTVHRWFANKSCPGEYLYSRHGKIASEVNAILSKSTSQKVKGVTEIISNPVATVEQMISYIKAKNPKVNESVIKMIPLYLSEGKLEGVAGDIAFSQSCLETGNFAFAGSAVTLDQNNFCGMGVTSNGMKGNSFDTPKIGIRAQIQHLKAYASTDKLVNECVDPRFNYVQRGCAKYVEWLGEKENPNGRGWATGAGYGQKIIKILDDIRAIKIATDEKHTQENAPKPSINEGDLVSIVNGSKYYNGIDIPDWVESKNWYVMEVAGDRAVINKSEDGEDAICSPINVKYLNLVKKKTFEPYIVRIDVNNLNIRTGPGVEYNKTGKFTGIGTFTIVEVKNGSGSKAGWGRLKSGAGWISLDYAKRV